MIVIGWPVLSLRTQRASIHDSLHIGALPHIPIVPGFIINTVFYAMLLWLPSTPPFAVRRKIRRRRGQCEKCAYPVGTSPVCTECGAAVSNGVPREAEV